MYVHACAWGGISPLNVCASGMMNDSHGCYFCCFLWQAFTGQPIVIAWTRIKNCFLKQTNGISINRGGHDLVFRLANSMNKKLGPVVQVTQCGLSPRGLAFAPMTTAYKFLALEPGSLPPTASASKFGQLAVVYVPPCRCLELLPMHAIFDLRLRGPGPCTLLPCHQDRLDALNIFCVFVAVATGEKKTQVWI